MIWIYYWTGVVVMAHFYAIRTALLLREHGSFPALWDAEVKDRDVLAAFPPESASVVMVVCCVLLALAWPGVAAFSLIIVIASRLKP